MYLRILTILAYVFFRTAHGKFKIDNTVYMQEWHLPLFVSAGQKYSCLFKSHTEEQLNICSLGNIYTAAHRMPSVFVCLLFSPDRLLNF